MLETMPFADRPNLPTLLSAASLSAEDKRIVTDFARDGYVVIDLKIPDFEALSDTIIEKLAPVYAAGHRIQDAWRISEEVKRLACNQRVLQVLELLYGRKAFPFQTLNFDVGTQQATHSDTIHFHAFPHHFMCGVWTALEDTDENNGPLHYYPGSQKLPVLTLADAGIRGSDKTGSYDYYERHYEPMIKQVVETRGLNCVEAYLKRGQALVWAANLLHGGSPIRQPGRTRHSQVTHYYFDDCVYYSPIWSDPAINKIYYRSPLNIVTGMPASTAYCGDRFIPPMKVRVKELAKNVLRRVHSAKSSM
ncbi:MAG TPA: phytanoyl-CoA dioxygenase family protein [Aliidongia sp.]|nr:phytanoyl-CoA dioxygenase family protein [Aliidongia sp.]